MSELKPCPRCGDEAQMLGSDSELLRLCRVICMNENCLTTTAINTKTRAEAARLWNTRPIEDTLRAERDELREELEEHKAMLSTVRSRLLEIDPITEESKPLQDIRGEIDRFFLTRALAKRETAEGGGT